MGKPAPKCSVIIWEEQVGACLRQREESKLGKQEHGLRVIAIALQRTVIRPRQWREIEEYSKNKFKGIQVGSFTAVLKNGNSMIDKPLQGLQMR